MRAITTNRLVEVVPQPEGEKNFSEMTDDEMMAYCQALVDGGIFDGVPGIPPC